MLNPHIPQGCVNERISIFSTKPTNTSYAIVQGLEYGANRGKYGSVCVSAVIDFSAATHFTEDGGLMEDDDHSRHGGDQHEHLQHAQGLLREATRKDGCEYGVGRADGPGISERHVPEGVEEGRGDEGGEECSREEELDLAPTLGHNINILLDQPRHRADKDDTASVDRKQEGVYISSDFDKDSREGHDDRGHGDQSVCDERERVSSEVGEEPRRVWLLLFLSYDMYVM